MILVGSLSASGVEIGGARVQGTCLRKPQTFQMQESEHLNHLCFSHKEVSMPIGVKSSGIKNQGFGGNCAHLVVSSSLRATVVHTGALLWN